MKISRVTYSLISGRPGGRSTLALCSVTFEGVFTVHKTMVTTDRSGNLCVKFPYQHSRASIKSPAFDGRHRNMYHATDSDFYEYISDTVIDGYYFCKNTGSRIYEPEFD